MIIPKKLGHRKKIEILLEILLIEFVDERTNVLTYITYHNKMEKKKSSAHSTNT